MNLRTKLGLIYVVPLIAVSLVALNAIRGFNQHEELNSRLARLNTSWSIVELALDNVAAGVRAADRESTAGAADLSRAISDLESHIEMAGRMAGDREVRNRVLAMGARLTSELEATVSAESAFSADLGQTHNPQPDLSGIRQMIDIARTEANECFGGELTRVGNAALSAAHANQRRAVALAGVPVISVVVVWAAIHFMVTRRIEALSACTQRIAAGDPGARIEMRGNDDLARLGASFSRMAEALTDKLSAERSLRGRLLNAERFALLGEFAASVAHGLGNPLASIRAAAELGALRAEDPTTYEEILDLARKLERHIAQILEVSRPAPAISVAFDVSFVIREAWSALEPFALSRGITASLDLADDLPEIDANHLSLERAFSSLIENAIEANPPGSTVQITTTLDGGVIVATIKDEGDGIADENRERVFSQFYTTKESGTGLGLSIAKRVVTSLGGTVALELGPEGGTIANVRIPV